MGLNIVVEGHSIFAHQFDFADVILFNMIYSANNSLDEIRQQHPNTILNMVLGDLVSLIHTADLPHLRGVNSLWRAIIDRELAQRIGPIVPDSAGYSTELIEFWIQAGLIIRADAIPRSSLMKFLPYCAYIPTLRRAVIDDTFVDVDKRTLAMAMIQLIRDRPLVALAESCSRLWTSYATVEHEHYHYLKFATTWNQIADPALLRTVYRYRYISSDYVMAATYRDIRSTALFELARGKRNFASRMVEQGLITMSSVIATQMINAIVCAVASGIHGAAVIHFMRHNCVGFYDPDFDNGHARSVVEASDNPLLISEAIRKIVGLE